MCTMGTDSFDVLHYTMDAEFALVMLREIYEADDRVVMGERPYTISAMHFHKSSTPATL